MDATKRVGRWKMIALSVVVVLLCGLGIATFLVEREAQYTLEIFAGGAGPKALILYHPSRDAHFSDDLTLAVAEGLKTAGFAVDRATLTGDTPDQLKGYRLLVVVSNTFYWTPDLPTLRYLKRARLDRIATLGVMAGAGSTTRSEYMLAQALSATGARVIGTRSFWTSRPNDPARASEPNRAVALQLAQQFALTAGRAELALLPVP